MIDKNKELIKLTTFVLGFFLSISSSLAQIELARSIEQDYQRIKSSIASQRFHQNEYKVNSQRFSLHQPGYRQHYVSYYYTFDQRPENDQKPLIKAVFVQSIKEETKFLKEYIFDNEGNFIYYSQKVMEESKMLDEVRLYIHNDEIIKVLREVGLENAELPFDSILQKAGRYKEKFKTQLSQVNFN